MRNFRDLQIWQDAITLTIQLYKLIDNFPDSEKYALQVQMKRATVSIPSNIAEGCRGSNKELKQFLNIALGSSFELETQLEIAWKLGYLPEEGFFEFVKKLNVLQKRINAFRTTISI
jgi:four helix bundle protein